MGFSIGDVFGGVVKIADAVGSVFGDRGDGKPGAGPAPSLIGQKPRLAFQRGKIGLGEGAGLMAGRGTIRGNIPFASRTEPAWVTLQRKYLSYLNMSEAFEEPGKVRRAIKLKV